MEGFVAADGGRFLKSGMLAFGALIWSAPVFAQASQDPLAPLPTPRQTAQPAAAVPSIATTTQASDVQPQQPIVVTQIAPPLRTIVVPKDWRGVFDAIDAG